MRELTGSGCWPGSARGTLVWLAHWEPSAAEPLPVSERPAALLAFRAMVAQAVAELERWGEQQEVVGARLLLQACREALLEEAWLRRVATLIDRGEPAALAAVGAAQAVAPVLSRSDLLTERAAQLPTVARWVAWRLAPPALPSDAILAAPAFHPVEMLGRRHPLLMQQVPQESLCPAEGPPVVWGLDRQIGPELEGDTVQVKGASVVLGTARTERHHWTQDWHLLQGDRLGEFPLCRLNGDLALVDRMARRLGEPVAVLIARWDDLAAVPILAPKAGLIAVDLDRFGPKPRLKHPGFLRLIQQARQAAEAADIQLLAGGGLARQQPDNWLQAGFTGFYAEHLRGGRTTHAVRGRTQSGF